MVLQTDVIVQVFNFVEDSFKMLSVVQSQFLKAVFSDHYCEDEVKMKIMEIFFLLQEHNAFRLFRHPQVSTNN